MINGVVAGYDGSETGARALEWAAAEAGARGVPLTVVHVWDVYIGGSIGMPTVDLRALAQQTLDQGAERVRQTAPDLKLNLMLKEGPAAAKLIETAGDTDLLVLGARGLGGFTGLMLGSVSTQAVAHAPCPVVIVRDGGRPERRNGVVAGVDGSPASHAALDLAFSAADVHRTPLTAMVAWPTAHPDDLPPLVDEAGLRETARNRLEGLLRPLRDRYPGVQAEGQIVTGRPRETLLAASTGARLLVVGSRGLGGVRGLLLGSVSHALVHHAQCPVAVVHAPGGGSS